MYYARNDPTSLASCLCALADDPVLLAQMAENANRRAHAQFTASTMISAYLNLYNSVLQSGLFNRPCLITPSACSCLRCVPTGTMAMRIFFADWRAVWFRSAMMSAVMSRKMAGPTKTCWRKRKGAASLEQFAISYPELDVRLYAPDARLGQAARRRIAKRRHCHRS